MNARPSPIRSHGPIHVGARWASPALSQPLRSLRLTLGVLALVLTTDGPAAAQGQPGSLLDWQRIDGNTSVESGEFGAALASLGDRDGDGVTDLLIGQPGGGYPLSQDPAGAVWIAHPNADGTIDYSSDSKIADGLGGLPDGTLDGFDEFGAAVASIGDVDGDGIKDIAVGAPGRNSGHGSVFILFLNADDTVKDFQEIGEGAGLLGPWTLDPGDGFGTSVASLSKNFGDSIPDLAVGAPFDDDGGTDRGAVYVLTLGTDGKVDSKYKISDTASAFSGSLDDWDFFGSSLGSLGDLDKDGWKDIAVGAPYGDGDDLDQGEVWILKLDATGVKDTSLIAEGINGFDDVLDLRDQLGIALAGVGDVDGDGVRDLAASGFGYGCCSLGVIWLLMMNEDGTVKSYARIESGEVPSVGTTDWFGSALASVGDFDGDTRRDLLAGAPGDDDIAVGAGTTYMLYLDAALWEDVGDGLEGSTGFPVLEGSGPAMQGETITLELTNAPALSLSFLAVGLEAWGTPFKGGTLVPSFLPPTGALAPFITNIAGEWSISPELTVALPENTPMWFQTWTVDSAPAWTASNAVKVTTP